MSATSPLYLQLREGCGTAANRRCGLVTPTGVKRKDYDFRVEYADGHPAGADANYRLEGTGVCPDTIVNEPIGYLK
jgi:hypothetical protein